MSMRERLISIFILSSVSRFSFAFSSEPASAISKGELIRVMLGLGLVLLIIMGLSWVTKRLHLVNLSSAKGFHNIGSMTLGPKEKIMLIKAGEHFLLLGVGGGVVNLLHDFGTELPKGFETGEKNSFAEILKSAVRKDIK
ncbi:MAG: flagellar biosynthetic protein FliO [Legionella sp.]|nr:flagellar biosynthetic protein FliO [Legionella sp.]